MSGAEPRSPSVLLVRLDAIGDALTLVPVIAALRRHGIRIGAVLRPQNAQVFSRRAVDRVHVDGGASQTQILREIVAERYDAALVATEKPRGYVLPKRARIPVRVGFENGWGKPLKTLWIRRMCTRTIFRTAGLDPRAPHECRVVFSLARALVDEFEPSRDSQVLRPLVVDEELPADDRVVFQVTRKWERLGAAMEDVAECARRIAGRRAVRCVAAQDEAGYARAFSQAAGMPVETFETLRPWKAAIAAARACVAPDSGAAHVAGMTGVPVVSCFSQEEFALQSRRWAPWAAPHRAVRIEPLWPMVAQDALEDLLSGSPQFFYTG